MKAVLLCVILAGMFPLRGQEAEAPFLFRTQPAELSWFSGWKYHYGDRPEWASADYDDAGWELWTPDMAHSENPEIRWYRRRIEIRGPENPYDVLSLYLRGIYSAYEVFWDGRQVLQNGRVGDSREAEIPGTYLQTARLRQDLTRPGIHQIAIRLSNHYRRQANPGLLVRIGYHTRLQGEVNRFYLAQIFNVGVMLLAFVFSLALFFGSRQRSYLLFGCYCLLFMVDIAVGLYLERFPVAIPYLEYFYILYQIITPATLLTLSFFFLLNFRIPGLFWHIGIIILLYVIIAYAFGRLHTAVISLYFAGLLGYAMYRREPGSAIAFTGVLIVSVFVILFLSEVILYSYTFGILLFVFCIILSISRQIRMQGQQLEFSRLRSARLETALLKKNIQPHFLMNTLLSIMSWIEASPARAINLIQALADEFRMINQISARREIPVSEELALCKAHLTVMGHRKDARYRLVCTPIPETETVPPMIFHTLIENGLTHAYRAAEDGTFYLNYERQNGRIHYQFCNSGSLLKKLTGQSALHIEDGMGMRYVKARLEESYPGRWELRYGVNGERWEVNIYIHRKEIKGPVNNNG